jgi:O-antigen ligase
VHGLYRVFYAENALNSIYITYNHLADLFGIQPLYLSVFYLMAVIFSIDISRSKLRQRKGYFIISGVLICGIILLSSRTGLLLSFVVLLIKVFKIKNKTAFPVFLLLLISCLILTFSIPTLKNRVLNLNENISSYSGLSFRTKIWKNSIFVFQESSLFGHGLYLSQDKLMNQYVKTNFRRGYIYNLNTHNQYLQTLLDTGLIGLTLLIFMLVLPIRNIRNIPISELLFTAIILVSLIPESFFLRQYGVLFYSFFSCIFQVSRKELGPKIELS